MGSDWVDKTTNRTCDVTREETVTPQTKNNHIMDRGNNHRLDEVQSEGYPNKLKKK